ncbi:hypothetical protein A2853_03575 [Candidatus Kaiserbacteria bacterium RIFCSPHIGHO2_01_FULL_55_17]|uniref:Uncharacterized protein n=1 Tax=Candidatus Kaiserbacteria bacterium RIFCSPHIGHO2_01_FULL_55_17 TaxID=1798484 RepID=A0A1F6D986_9BACT|nr:MAG: hypothetical protein A2853_03575 [Candidatus Kaiserbacteria bacterium RIFCSPHIGHO2_01_FULL_55_17]
MKHIKEILAERQASLFSKPKEKGSGEWHTFNIVCEDKIDLYRVTLPRRAIVTREDRHVLRIVYPQPIPGH